MIETGKKDDIQELYIKALEEIARLRIALTRITKYTGKKQGEKPPQEIAQEALDV